MCFLTPAFLPSCQMSPLGALTWVRDRDKHKSFRFPFISRVGAPGVLSAGHGVESPAVQQPGAARAFIRRRPQSGLSAPLCRLPAAVLAMNPFSA